MCRSPRGSCCCRRTSTCTSAGARRGRPPLPARALPGSRARGLRAARPSRADAAPGRGRHAPPPPLDTLSLMELHALRTLPPREAGGGPGRARLLARLHDWPPPLCLRRALVSHTPLVASFVPSPFVRRRQALMQRPGRARPRTAQGAAGRPLRPSAREPYGAGGEAPPPLFVDAAGVVTSAALAGARPWAVRGRCLLAAACRAAASDALPAGAGSAGEAAAAPGGACPRRRARRARRAGHAGPRGAGGPMSRTRSIACLAPCLWARVRPSPALQTDLRARTRQDRPGCSVLQRRARFTRAGPLRALRRCPAVRPHPAPPGARPLTRRAARRHAQAPPVRKPRRPRARSPGVRPPARPQSSRPRRLRAQLQRQAAAATASPCRRRRPRPAGRRRAGASARC